MSLAVAQLLFDGVNFYVVASKVFLFKPGKEDFRFTLEWDLQVRRVELYKGVMYAASNKGKGWKHWLNSSPANMTKLPLKIKSVKEVTLERTTMNLFWGDGFKMYEMNWDDVKEWRNPPR